MRFLSYSETRRRLFAACLVTVGLVYHAAAMATPVPIAEAGPGQPLGRHAEFMKEPGAPLTINEAISLYAAGKFTPGSRPILAFGIGPRPVWIRLRVSNPGKQAVYRQLQVENSWLDHIDVYFVRNGQTTDAYHTGDSQPFSERPLPKRFFSFEHEFAPGSTDIYLRVETEDPVVVPIFLLTEKQAAHKEMEEGYSYGFLYGYLLALLCYNLFIFMGLHNRANLLYAGFIAIFILMNIAYTGHGFAWFWPQHVTLQRWIIPTLMVAYGLTGLLFAKYFLDTRTHLPRTDRFVSWASGLAVLLLLVAFTLQSQKYVLIDAFAFVTFFTLMMLTIGIMSFRAGLRYSRYFLFASIASMVGASITDLAVWGFIPYNDWTYRAVEIGMLVDATLLALALTYQIRSMRVEHQITEQLAYRDPLTGLDNRRSFMEKAQAAWSTAQRSRRSLSAIILDLDHFKTINDQHGHAMGDIALVRTATILAESARDGDIVARWGGEEFLLLLPETDLEAALSMARRLQQLIAEIRLPTHDGDVMFTASFGVAEKGRHENVESLISAADRQLYNSKAHGRNRISSEPEPGPEPQVQG